jgi:hypothetical protein
MELLGKLSLQAVNYPQQGESDYLSAQSPIRGTMPGRLWMGSSLDHLTGNNYIWEQRMLPDNPVHFLFIDICLMRDFYT